VTAARRPESWEEIWDAPLAALTEADAPPDEQDYGWLDPDIDPPAELVGLTGAELAELLADAPTQSAPPEGTASLTGRYLPPAAALTASKRLGQIAAGWKSQGAQGGTDLLRTHAYLALLNGQAINTPPASLMPAMPAPGPLGPDDRYPAIRNSSGYGADRDSGPAGSAGSGPDGQPTPGQHGEPVPGSLDRPGAGWRQVPPSLRHPGADGLPALAGLINLTVPLTTLLGLANAPGAVAGYGPLDADTTRLLACTAAGHPATDGRSPSPNPADRPWPTALPASPPPPAEASPAEAHPAADGQCA
jgi:hypothetical protein